MKRLFLVLFIAGLACMPSLSAQGFWDPPGEDPCDNPMNPPCYGEDAYPGDAVGGAATEVGRKVNEYAETDLAWGFIFWLSETFGPNIPKEDPKPEPEPEPEPKDDPKDDGKDKSSSKSSSSPTLRTGVWVVNDAKFNSKIRAYFDGYSEGQRLKTGAKAPAGYQVRYTLMYKREDLKKVRQEYDLTVRMSVRRPNGKVFHQPIHILAQPGKVFFLSPKRPKR